MFKRLLAGVVDIASRLPESGLKNQLREVLYKDVVSERIVEYPLILRHLKFNSGKILDVGCRYSNLVLQLGSLGYTTYGLDLEPYPYTHPNLKFIRGDVRNCGLKGGLFDVVTCVSTLEHIGLGYYESDPVDLEGDAKAVTQIYRLLKPRGQLLITVPFGRPTITASYRVYDRQGLENLLAKFSRRRYSYFKKDAGSWLPTSRVAAEKVDSATKVAAVVLVDCRK